MMLVRKKVTVILAGLLFVAINATSANNAEQVVFSTPGFTMALSGNTKAQSTPFGFWLWCAAEAAPGSNGGYQNANACQGSMYFYALDTHVTPVIGQTLPRRPLACARCRRPRSSEKRAE